MHEQNKSYTFLYIICTLIVIVLVYAGVNLIVQSNKGYNTSLHYTELALKDFALKAKFPFAPNYSIIKDGYTESFSYFMLALGVIILAILLPRLQNISFGTSGINLTLKDLPQKVDALIKQTNAIQSSSVGEGGGYKTEFKQELKEAPLINLDTKEIEQKYPNDPQKGKWGRLATRNDRKLSAQVVASALPFFYKVTLTVETTNKEISENLRFARFCEFIIF